ncbi:MAG: hypothetical protein AAF823_00595 [Planctomycetota bacterium]
MPSTSKPQPDATPDADAPAPSSPPTAPAAPRRLLVWADAERAPHVAGLIAARGEAVTLVGVGGSRSAELGKLAADANAPITDDLRALIASSEADRLILATAEHVAPRDLGMAVETGLDIRALELPLTSLSDLREAIGDAAGPKGESPLVLTPSVLRTPGLAAASDPLPALGEVRAVCVRHAGPARCGTVWTRLVDAWLAVLTLGKRPETIDATLRTKAARQPDDPLAVHGTVVAHGRGLKACAASVVVSDTALGTRRRIDAFAEHGYLELTDHAYLLLSDGDPPIDAAPDPHQPADFPALLAHHAAQLDDDAHTHARTKLTRLREAVACGLATLLSARTGQPESPHGLLELDR